jgi:rubrerythrin
MPTTTLDYTTLSLKDALDLAVLIEEEARDRYTEFAQQLEQAHTPAAAEFFSKMVRNEERHRVQLLERRKSAFGDAPVTVKREMIWDVEAPEYDEARAFMTHRQALEAAMRSEVKAHDFFVAVEKQVMDRGVQALFHELAHEELEHQAMVKAELAKAPPDDPVKGDPGDEPAPQ